MGLDNTQLFKKNVLGKDHVGLDEMCILFPLDCPLSLPRLPIYLPRPITIIDVIKIQIWDMIWLLGLVQTKEKVLRVEGKVVGGVDVAVSDIVIWAPGRCCCAWIVIVIIIIIIVLVTIDFMFKI